MNLKMWPMAKSGSSAIIASFVPGKLIDLRWGKQLISFLYNSYYMNTEQVLSLKRGEARCLKVDRNPSLLYYLFCLPSPQPLATCLIKLNYIFGPCFVWKYARSTTEKFKGMTFQIKITENGVFWLIYILHKP